MEKLNRLHGLMEEFADIAKEMFPDYTIADFFITNDGYRSIAVSKWGKGEKSEITPRLQLFAQVKVAGHDWDKDRSDSMNEYYDQKGLLLKEDCAG